jgi:hypothetical protein
VNGAPEPLPDPPLELVEPPLLPPDDPVLLPPLLVLPPPLLPPDEDAVVPPELLPLLLPELL